PEVAGGAGFSGTDGVAGFPNGEATRVGVPNPTPYIARLFVRQTFGFGGEREWAPDDENQVAGERDVRRLAVIVASLRPPTLRTITTTPRTRARSSSTGLWCTTVPGTTPPMCAGTPTAWHSTTTTARTCPSLTACSRSRQSPTALPSIGTS